MAQHRNVLSLTVFRVHVAAVSADPTPELWAAQIRNHAMNGVEPDGQRSCTGLALDGCHCFGGASLCVDAFASNGSSCCCRTSPQNSELLPSSCNLRLLSAGGVPQRAAEACERQQA